MAGMDEKYRLKTEPYTGRKNDVPLESIGAMMDLYDSPAKTGIRMFIKQELGMPDYPPKVRTALKYAAFLMNYTQSGTDEVILVPHLQRMCQEREGNPHEKVKGDYIQSWLNTHSRELEKFAVPAAYIGSETLLSAVWISFFSLTDVISEHGLDYLNRKQQSYTTKGYTEKVLATASLGFIPPNQKITPLLVLKEIIEPLDRYYRPNEADKRLRLAEEIITMQQEGIELVRRLNQEGIPYSLEDAVRYTVGTIAKYSLLVGSITVDPARHPDIISSYIQVAISEKLGDDCTDFLEDITMQPNAYLAFLHEHNLLASIVRDVNARFAFWNRINRALWLNAAKWLNPKPFLRMSAAKYNASHPKVKEAFLAEFRRIVEDEKLLAVES